MRPLHELILEAAAKQGPNFTSRRGVLALAGAAAAAPAIMGFEKVMAQANAEKKKKNNNNNRDKNKNQRKKDIKNDIAVLNYALTLEHLEYAFYRDGLAEYDMDGDFEAGVRARLLNIRDHEDTHVDALIATIQGLGGDPVEELCYDFGYDNPDEFLDVAALLENTGVMAYDGAIARIRSGSLQTTGATIATVEARHASYLNLITGADPFPAAFDEPKTEAEILAAAGGFIVACP